MCYISNFQSQNWGKMGTNIAAFVITSLKFLECELCKQNLRIILLTNETFDKK